MVEHLLAGTRPADAAPALHTNTIDLTTVADTAVATCRLLAARHNVAVTVRTASPAPVRADLARLAHAVEQLIRNAIQFTPAGGAVTGDARPATTISDTGIGIPAHELPHVFDRFYRGHHARTQAAPGVGLGLTIARTIVTAHHGSVQLSSTPEGTTARITL